MERTFESVGISSPRSLVRIVLRTYHQPNGMFELPLNTGYCSSESCPSSEPALFRTQRV